MIKNYIIYNPTDGRIELWGRGSEDLIPLQAPPGLVSLIGTGYPPSNYVALPAGTLEAKTDSGYAWDTLTILADGIEEATLSGLTANTRVTLPDGTVEVVSDGVIEFSVDLAGSYSITVDSPEYFEVRFTIEATA